MMDRNSVLAAFDQRVERYEAELARCQTAFSEEAVHDLRVAIRRLLALLDLLRAPGFGLRGKKLRRELKGLLDSLGALRDTQVMLAFLSPTQLKLPAGALFRDELQQREARLLGQAREAVGAVDLQRVHRRLAKRRQQLLACEDAAGWPAALQQALQMAWERVWQRHRRVRAGSLASIHRERIAFKRFRYTVEIVARIDPAGIDEAVFLTLRRYQTLLGEIQDAVVLCAALQRFRKRHPVVEASVMLHRARQLRDERVARYWRERDSLLLLQALYTT